VLPSRKVTVTKRHTVRSQAKPPAPKTTPRHPARNVRTVLHRTKKPTAAHTSLPAKLKPHSKVSDEISLPLPAPVRSGSAGLGLASFLIVLALVCAIACFAVALVPATYMRWRPAVIFASERQTDLTVAGLALLTVTAFMVVWSKGF
jgi:hypothetical protein